MDVQMEIEQEYDALEEAEGAEKEEDPEKLTEKRRKKAAHRLLAMKITHLVYVGQAYYGLIDEPGEAPDEKTPEEIRAYLAERLPEGVTLQEFLEDRDLLFRTRRELQDKVAALRGFLGLRVKGPQIEGFAMAAGSAPRKITHEYKAQQSPASGRKRKTLTASNGPLPSSNPSHARALVQSHLTLSSAWYRASIEVYEQSHPGASDMDLQAARMQIYDIHLVGHAQIIAQAGENGGNLDLTTVTLFNGQAGPLETAVQKGLEVVASRFSFENGREVYHHKAVLT